MYDENMKELLSEWEEYNKTNKKISLQEYLVNVLSYSPNDAVFITMTAKMFC